MVVMNHNRGTASDIVAQYIHSISEQLPAALG